MRERVEIYGGEFTTRPRSGGGVVCESIYEIDDNFLSSQLKATEPLEYVRIWAPAGDADDYALVLQLERDEDGPDFDVHVQAPFAGDNAAELSRLGFVEGHGRISGTDPIEAASRLSDLLAAVAPNAQKLSLTHGSNRDEVMRRRRLEAVVARINEVIGSQAAPGAWTNDTKIPVQFRAGSVALTLWPKDVPPDVLLEVWALVATAAQDKPEIETLRLRCNGTFNYGRIVQQESTLWYRDIIHASPLSDAALKCP